MTTAPRKPKSNTDAIVMSVPERKENFLFGLLFIELREFVVFIPSTITKPKKVRMTVAIANTKNMMNGSVMDIINADAPNAKNGCLASCLAIRSKNT